MAARAFTGERRRHAGCECAGREASPRELRPQPEPALSSRFLTVATGQLSCRAAWSYVIP